MIRIFGDVVLSFLFCQVVNHLSNDQITGAMGKPQHGNSPKSDFGSVSFFYQELSESHLKLKSVQGFPNILGWFLLYLLFICFPFFFNRFPHFFGSVSSFQKKVYILSLLEFFLKTGSGPKK